MEILMPDIKSHSWFIRLFSPFCIRALFHLASCRRQRCHSKVEPTLDIFLRCTSRLFTTTSIASHKKTLKNAKVPRSHFSHLFKM